MEENERLAKHASQLTLDNHALRQQLPNVALPDGKRRFSGQVSPYVCFNMQNVLRFVRLYQNYQQRQDLEFVRHCICISV
jgi:hypothetical protein